MGGGAGAAAWPLHSTRTRTLPAGWSSKSSGTSTSCDRTRRQNGKPYGWWVEAHKMGPRRHMSGQRTNDGPGPCLRCRRLVLDGTLDTVISRQKDPAVLLPLIIILGTKNRDWEFSLSKILHSKMHTSRTCSLSHRLHELSGTQSTASPDISSPSAYAPPPTETMAIHLRTGTSRATDGQKWNASSAVPSG